LEIFVGFGFGNFLFVFFFKLCVLAKDFEYVLIEKTIGIDRDGLIDSKQSNESNIKIYLNLFNDFANNIII